MNKDTKKIHDAGEIIEVSKERLEEINNTKYGALVEEVKSTAKTDTPKKKVKWC